MQPWRTVLETDPNLGPPVVALGKFDALHRGHQKLAITAVHLGGTPHLVSFDGMAEVFGWAPRLPLVAPCDRRRVLSSWKRACLNTVPREHRIPFGDVRNMAPEDFVELLARDLGAKGVVVGSNYRFGYKAAGTAETLKSLGSTYGMKVEIVNLVEESNFPVEHGLGDIVSSTKIRKGLGSGDFGLVAQCLGRTYRLVAWVDVECLWAHGVIPYSDFLNQYPTVGRYDGVRVLVAESCPEEYTIDEEASNRQTTSIVFDSERGAVTENIHIPDGLNGHVYCIIDF